MTHLAIAAYLDNYEEFDRPVLSQYVREMDDNIFHSDAADIALGNLGDEELRALIIDVAEAREAYPHETTSTFMHAAGRLADAVLRSTKKYRENDTI